MDKEYGVLHEIGDYYKPKKLSDEDNRSINEQLNEEKKEKKNDNK